MVKLTLEEKNKRKEERRQKKWLETHKSINGIDHKKCTICQKWLPMNEEYFYKNKSNGADGFHTYCKNCTIEKEMKRIEQDPNYWDKHRIRMKEVMRQPERKESRKKSRKKWLELGKQTEWQKENPEKLREYANNRKMHKSHTISDDEWKDCKEYFNNECAYCGIHIDNHYTKYAGELKKTDFHKEHVDHNGANDITNCVPSCQSCNSQKWKWELEEWYNPVNNKYTKERYLKIIDWLIEGCFEILKTNK